MFQTKKDDCLLLADHLFWFLFSLISVLMLIKIDRLQIKVYYLCVKGLMCCTN